MAIRTIEIICIPCPKCDRVKQMIAAAIKQIELQNRIKLTYELKHTPNLSNLANYSVNASQTPAVVINGRLELAGMIEQPALIKKLETIHRGD